MTPLIILQAEIEKKNKQIKELLAMLIQERQLAAKQLSDVVDRMSNDYLEMQANKDAQIAALRQELNEYRKNNG